MSGVTYEFWLAGSAGYQQGKERFRPRDKLTFEVAASVLMRTAGLSRGGRSLARLPAILQRLQVGVRVDRRTMPAVLVGFESLERGRFRLSVAPAWFPKRFDRVPLPVPTSGANVLALFLFLFGADRRPDTETSIRFKTLCERIGIPISRPAHATRSLDRALEQVNRHLRTLRAELDAMDLPAAFKIEPAYGQRIRFVPIYKVANTAARRQIERRRPKEDSDEAPLRSGPIDMKELMRNLGFSDEDAEINERGRAKAIEDLEYWRGR
jgi:hypothetical protein